MRFLISDIDISRYRYLQLLCIVIEKLYNNFIVEVTKCRLFLVLDPALPEIILVILIRTKFN